MISSAFRTLSPTSYVSDARPLAYFSAWSLGFGAGTESISLATNPAAVQLDATISAVLEGLQLTANQAAIIADNDTNLNAGLESINVTPQPAALSIGLNLQAEQITLGSFLAVVSASTQLLGTVESIQLGTSSASVTTGSAIGAGTETISLQGQSATVALDIALSAQTQSIVLSELSAQVGLSTNIGASVESLTITPQGGVVTLTSGISATLQALTLSTFNAIITAPVSSISTPGIEYTIPINRLHFTFRS